jgi:hypothetical protein
LSTPAGFRRVRVASGSYAHWLRHLPLRKPGTPVRDHRGAKLPSSTAVAEAVVDLDVGRRDLQQCVDTLIRLRAEYHWWKKQPHRARFRYAGGRYFGWAQWARGIRPRRRDGRIVYERRAHRSLSRKNFRRYLTFMFAMTGTMHNVREPRVPFARMEAGHFFIQPPPRPGLLGHAVVILDVARPVGSRDRDRGRLRALLGEGFTPAQSFHVLQAPHGGAWFTLDPKKPVQTPLWGPPFQWSQLRRFRY